MKNVRVRGKASTCALNTTPRLAQMMQGLALQHRHGLQGPSAESGRACVPRHWLISHPHHPSPMQFIDPAPFGFKLSLASEKGAAMPFPICFGPKRRAVVDLDPEPDNRQSAIGTADASTQTAIGLVEGPKLFIHDVREAPLYMSRREYELFVKRHRHHVATQTGLE